MLSKSQKFLLLSEMLSRKTFLRGNTGDYVETRRIKRQAWDEILQILIATSYRGSIEELRDIEFSNIRKSTLRKLDYNTQNGNKEGCPKKLLTQLDNMVIDYLAEDPKSTSVKHYNTDVPTSKSDICLIENIKIEAGDQSHLHESANSFPLTLPTAANDVHDIQDLSRDNLHYEDISTPSIKETNESVTERLDSPIKLPTTTAITGQMSEMHELASNSRNIDVKDTDDGRLQFILPNGSSITTSRNLSGNENADREDIRLQKLYNLKRKNRSEYLSTKCMRLKCKKLKYEIALLKKQCADSNIYVFDSDSD